MPIRPWFPTFIYCEPLQRGGGPFAADLAEECRQLREFDAAGRTWSARNYPGGYTSYGSMAQLQKFSSTFAALEKKLARHVRAFARALEFDLRGREIRLTDCWANIMPPAAAHSLHLHPLAFISGTFYAATPAGSPGLKFEDPRLDRFMAAPPRRPEARAENKTHVTYPAEAGQVILFESWLRHEVPPNPVDAERISISFNYNWA
ncbi:MAG: TIGR02466 family protein [Opitutaceae bacterium]|jgi:uncharacterized protein (TIGR02466 family)